MTSRAHLCRIGGGLFVLVLGSLRCQVALDPQPLQRFESCDALQLYLEDQILHPGAESAFTTSGPVIGCSNDALEPGQRTAGVAVAATLDLPEHAGSLALSGAIWTPVLVGLGASMFDVFRNDPQQLAPFITVAANAGFIAGMSTATFVPLLRAETWALDVGGGVGLLAGIATATVVRAGNPPLGYGLIASGTLAGMAGGVAAAKLVPQWVNALPEVVALAPFIVPSDDGKHVTAGAGLIGRFD